MMMGYIMSFIKQGKTFLCGLLEEQFVSPQQKDYETNFIEEDSQESTLPKVISGTDGLKDYIGCSHNKAFDIIKSRILPKDVQYKTGNVWKFNRAKLDKFISEKPELLGKVRAKGRLDE